MDVSDFKVSTSSGAPTVVPPPAAAPAPTPVPLAMREQRADEALPAASEETSTERTTAPTAADVLDASAPAATTEEAPAEPAKAEAPAKVDPRFSALARKEAELHRAREAMKAEKAALEAAHRQVVAFEEARSVAKRDPLAALEALGISVNDVNERVLNGNVPTPADEVASLREEIERLRVDQESARVKAEEAAAARLAVEQKAIIEEARVQAVEHVRTNPTRYDLTIANFGETLVPQVREEHFARTGKLLTVEQAADLVEKHFEGIADRVANARKFQAKLQSRTSPAPAATPPAAQKTLSNALTASATAATPKARSDADRIRAALARLEGK